MTIIEAISQNLEEVTELSNSYIGRIYVKGLTKYAKPVDFRLLEITIPLKMSSINFIYDNETKEMPVFKSDSILTTYFPIGSTLNLTNGGRIKLLSYSGYAIYNNKVYVDMNCELLDDEYYILENIDNTSIKERVKNELNNIIESNEIIKNLLPQYSYNMLKYTDEDIDAIKKLEATKVLHLIDKLEYDERYYIMSNINSALSQSYTNLPSSIISDIKKISTICIKDRVSAGFSGIHSYYNPRYVFEWLIYCIENKLIEETIYDEFYLVNKLGSLCKIKVSTPNLTNYVIEFTMPDESIYNFRLTLTNCISTGDYIEYIIDSMKLEKIDKETGIIEEIENLSNQDDNLEAATEIISILSASNYTGSIDDYYSNIINYLSEINTTVPIKTEEDKENEPNTEEENEPNTEEPEKGNTEEPEKGDDNIQ